MKDAKMQFNLKRIIWIFGVACFIGYIIEMLFCIVVHAHIESRQGVIFGPFTPIYGVGSGVCSVVFLQNGFIQHHYIRAGC